MRVLIVPDKFKGTLTARQAAEAIALGWKKSRPQDDLKLLPMSDGGDGFGPVLGDLLGAERKIIQGTDAAGEPREAAWWWSHSSKTAIVETAQSIGLALLPKGKFHPFQLDTFALGNMFKDAAAHGPEHIIIGIGGSATNDAGFGMARGIGYRFLNAEGREIVAWTDLEHLEHVEKPPAPLFTGKITVAVDVQNPLLGPSGASRVYGPQKGMRPEDFPLADRCFERLTQIVRRDLQIHAEDEPGTGAAGGLGYGLRVFLCGSFQPGISIFSELADLPAEIKRSDLVITAEGAIDDQTLMGKGTGAIAQLAREAGVPCAGMAGVVKETEGPGENQLFTRVTAIVPAVAEIEQALAEPARFLSELARREALQFA
jgi:glycerate kinase